MKNLSILIILVFIVSVVYSQNLGIGTQSPQAKVQIVQESGANALQVDDEKNDLTPMVVDSNGNVGIQNAQPKEALDVNGNIKSNGRILDKSGFVMPVGSILPYTGTVAPQGWLLCDGSKVSRSTYTDLFQVVGVSFGEGDGFSTFNVPDFRGMFLRGWDNGAGNDPDASSRTASNTGGNTGDKIGTTQTDEFKSHSHDINTQILNSQTNGSDGTFKSGTTAGATTNATGGNETRPKNISVNFIIKY